MKLLKNILSITMMVSMSCSGLQGAQDPNAALSPNKDPQGYHHHSHVYQDYYEGKPDTYDGDEDTYDGGQDTYESKNIALLPKRVTSLSTADDPYQGNTSDEDVLQGMEAPAGNEVVNLAHDLFDLTETMQNALFEVKEEEEIKITQLPTAKTLSLSKLLSLIKADTLTSFQVNGIAEDGRRYMLKAILKDEKNNSNKSKNNFNTAQNKPNKSKNNSNK